MAGRRAWLCIEDIHYDRNTHPMGMNVIELDKSCHLWPPKMNLLPICGVRNVDLPKFPTPVWKGVMGGGNLYLLCGKI